MLTSIKSVSTWLLALASLTDFSNTQATLISFDDLVLTPPISCDFCPQTLSNEYATLGLLFDGAYLESGGLTPTGNQLLGTPLTSITFLAPFPTTVSMYVSARAQDMVVLQAWGPAYYEIVKTEGWGGPLHDTPYVPNQLVSFFAPDGIENIALGGFFGLRVDAEVDNIFFSTATAVTAPSSAALLFAGVLGWSLLSLRTPKRS